MCSSDLARAEADETSEIRAPQGEARVDDQAGDRPSRRGQKDRKPRREREAKRSSGKPRSAHHGERGQVGSSAPVANFASNSQLTPSIGRPEAPRAGDLASEPADHSHLPAFLLRPIRARV